MDRAAVRCGAVVWGVAAAVALSLGPWRAAHAEGEALGRWTVGFRVADFLPADAQGGGFRQSGQVFGSRVESRVKLRETFIPSFTLGREVKRWEGAKRWQNARLTLELDVSRLDTSFGNEVAFVDPDASTRVQLCNLPGTAPTGDEEYKSVSLGDVTVTPILFNALMHWGSGRADFYAGGGLGWVMASASESAAYRAMVGDNDGVQDLVADDAAALDIKVGSNVKLDRNGRWLLFFEAQFLSTQLLSGQQQITWPGVDAFFGQSPCDINGDNIPDTVDPADFRLVDPGKVRVDGATAGIGLRFRFGGSKASAEQAEPAASSPADGS